MKQQFSLLPKIAALSIAAAFAAPAMAQTAGSNIVNLGWFHLAPQDSSEGIRGVGGLVNGSNSPDAHSTVSNADTVGVAFTHFFTDNIALTADLGLPPKFKLTGTGTLSRFGEIGSAKQWSPAIVAKYFFGDATDKFRPFVGAGVTYVWYSDVKLNQSFQQYAGGGAVNPALTTGNASASLSSSLAPVASLGATYNVSDRWSIGFSVSYIPLKTDADITGQGTAAGTLKYKTSLTINPIVSFLSVGYKF
ncbi:OmpW/AlkL family protein [Herbaspirillum rhizosphaerae]|uniref:OmpW/AlkL family protein n=1 Tax=Herbaspirillum rhizosphaerae TaxID=346179 RepID=UPI00067D8606|nr:OmpW family outer membrane protein [Herbaspirillum rhizosphaerae]